MAENTKIEVAPTLLAYLAGMIDGDGYVSIVRSVRAGKEYYGAQIGIAGTSPETHKLAASIWGGVVSRYEPANPNHRAQYQWSRQGAQAAVVIMAVMPYLLIKQEHAALALELHDHVCDARAEDPFPWFGPDFDPVLRMRAMRDEMIALNQSRNRVGKKAAGRLLDGRTWDGFPAP